MLKEMNPDMVVAYLEHTGWRLLPRKKNKVYQKERDGKLFQVTVPMDKDLSDYEAALYHALDVISKERNRPISVLIAKMIHPKENTFSEYLQTLSDTQLAGVFDEIRQEDELSDTSDLRILRAIRKYVYSIPAPMGECDILYEIARRWKKNMYGKEQKI